jgi:hypothetical protein
MVRQPFTTKYELSYNSEHINFYGEYDESNFEPILHLLRYETEEEENNDNDYDFDELNNAILFINQTTRDASSTTTNEVVNLIEPSGDY